MNNNKLTKAIPTQSNDLLKITALLIECFVLLFTWNGDDEDMCVAYAYTYYIDIQVPTT